MGKIITALPAADAIDLDNDYIPVRQTQSSGEKTRRMPLRDVTQTLQPSITAATAAAQAAQDTADAAIPLTQKGAINGVATLDGSGKVPASQLTIVATAFKGNWNATTNSPTLVDGTGTGGDWYFIQTVSQSDFTRDLGSGNVDWTPGALIIYNGTIWVENEAVNNVLAVNGQTGNVSLTTNEIPEATDLNYVTDDQSDSFPAGASASDQLIKQSELDAAIAAITDPGIVVIGGTYCPQLFDHPDYTSGTGELKILSDLGITNGDAETRWPLAASNFGGSIDTTATSLDDVLWACFWEGYKSGTVFSGMSLPNKAYAFQRCNIKIPGKKDSPTNNTNSQHFIIDFNGCIYFNRSGVPKPVFVKVPLDQDDADESIDYQWSVKNAKFRGPGGVGDYGIHFTAARGSIFENLEFQNQQYGFKGAFLLNSIFTNVNSISCSGAGIYIDKGSWSGATYANSGTQPKFYNCRQRMTSSSAIGVWLIGTDSAGMYGCTSEGTAALYGVKVENSTSTVSKNFEIHLHHAEIGGAAQFSRAVIGTSLRDFNTFSIDKLYNQAGVPDTILLEAENTQGLNVYEITNCKGNSGANRWKLKNTNSGGAGGYIIKNCDLQGAPQTIDDIRAGNDVFVAGSDMPPASRFIFEKAIV